MFLIALENLDILREVSSKTNVIENLGDLSVLVKVIPACFKISDKDPKLQKVRI